MGGSDGSAGPPRIARWLLLRIIGGTDIQRRVSGRGADQVEPSLDELFRIRSERSGRRAARRWYWRQVVGFAFRRRSLRAHPGSQGAAARTRRAATSEWLLDARLAVRSLRHRPGFAVLAIGALAIGIAANATVFSVIDAALFRPLPFPHAERLVSVRTYLPREDRRPFATFAQFGDWRASVDTSADALVAYQARWSFVEWADGAAEVSHQPVSVGFLELLDARTSQGRIFSAADYRADAPATAVVSDEFWQGELAGDPDVLGRALEINGVHHEIVGVLSAGFRFTTFATRVYRPLRAAGVAAMEPDEPVRIVARLRQGATAERLAAELGAAVREDGDVGAPAGDLVVPFVEPIRAELYGWAADRFSPFMGVVAFVLLMVAANLANLMLVRTASRSGETAVRAALGAGRWRLARLVVAEVLVVAVAAAGLGVLLTFWGISLLTRLNPLNVAGAQPKFDLRVVVFAAMIALLAGLVSSLGPALSTVRRDFLSVLNQGGQRAGGGAYRTVAQRGVVVFQIACAMLLLTGAGLLTKTIVRMHAYDPGFDTRNLLQFYTTFPAELDEEARARLLREILDGVRAVPGVVSAGAAASGGSFSFGLTDTEGGVTLEGHSERLPMSATTERGSYSYRSPGYFETLGVPVLLGRGFAPADFQPGAPPVALVNEEAARRWWPDSGREVVGKRFKLGPPSSPNPWVTVVGVVKTIQTATVQAIEWEPPTSVHLPLGDTSPAPTQYFYLRASHSPSALVPLLRAVVEEAHPDLLVRNPEDQTGFLAAELAYYRVNADILLAFATFGVVLAAMGLYGVVAYGVVRRTREIGIRMALGANSAHVLRSVTRESAVLAGVGIAAGLVLSAMLTRMLESMLFGVSPLDPLVFALAAALFAAVVVLAAYVPAQRATRVDPMIALRST